MKKLLISFSLILFGMVIVYGVNADDKQTVTSLKYVNDVLVTKQDEIGAQSGTMAVTFTDTAGVITATTVTGTLGNSTSDTSLPMVSGVNTKLATKQDEIPAKNTNTVLTYTGVAGTVGEKGIYQDTGTYASQTDSLIDAGTFNAALKNGLDNEFVCAGYATTGECWLWTIHNDGESANLFNGVMYSGGLSSSKAYIQSGFEVVTSPFTPTLQWKGAAFYTKVKPNTTYVLTYDTNATYKHVTYYANESDINTPSLALGFNVVLPSSNTFTTPDGTNYVVISFVNGNTNDITWSNVELKETMPDNALLPTGYTPLEYIDTGNTAGPYIDTGVTYDSTKEIVVNLTAQANSSSVSIMTVLGFGGNYGQLLGVNADGKWSIGTGGVSNISALNKTSDIEVKWNDGIQYLKIGGVNVGTHDITNGGTKLNLFGRFGEGTFKGKIYFAQVIVDGEIVHSFVPAKNSSNVVGMYDTVTGTFFTNAATSGDDFTAGPAISNVVYIPQNQ